MKRIIKLFPELIALPAMVVAWLAVTRLIPVVFPTAGIIDEGIIQVPIIALVFTLFANLAVYASIKYNEPFLWKWYKEKFDEPYPSSAPWLFLVMYAVRLIAFAIMVVAIA